MTHAYANETQIIWNGILGEMKIEAFDPVRISNLQVYPDIALSKAKLAISLNNSTKRKVKGVINIVAVNKKTNISRTAYSKKISINPGRSRLEVDYDMGKDFQLWDEFSPELYELKAQLNTSKNKSFASVDFGMLNFSRKGSVLTINNRAVFLRGT